MKLDYCAIHSGGVIGNQDLRCGAIRHDDGTVAKPAEVWDEMQRLRVDAERYRWLRENLTRLVISTTGMDVWNEVSGFGREVESIEARDTLPKADADSVDRAVDAAMAGLSR